MFATPRRWRSPILEIQARKVELLSFPRLKFCSINLYIISALKYEAASLHCIYILQINITLIQKIDTFLKS